MNKLVFLSCLFLLFSCKESIEQHLTSPSTNSNIVANDTIVVKTSITDEIAGLNYRKRATRYHLIINGDTSLFACILSESNSNGYLTLFIDNKQCSTTYQQRFKELKHLLPKAALDYNLDSISSISFGRFIYWGDLAIETTEDYLKKDFDNNKSLNQNFTSFLPFSVFGTELNKLLKPYHLKVKSVSLEKVFFLTKEDFFKTNITTIDSSKAPNKIIDCITWVNIEKM